MTTRNNAGSPPENEPDRLVDNQENTGSAYQPEGIEDAFVTGADQPADAETKPKRTAGGPQLGFVGWMRFLWRQLTSMRVALMLLMLLAVAALPGSLFPQRAHDLAGVNQYLADNPTLGPLLDKWSFFNVYASPWFAAVYLLLFISLIGCIVPRIKVHYKALRSAPPKTPRVFTRFPAKANVVLTPEQANSGVSTSETGGAAHAAALTAQRHLRGRFGFLPKFRTTVTQENDTTWTVSAERGYLKETGNLLFHLSLVGILISFGTGQLLEYRGQAILIEGRGFANAQVAYNTFEHGAWFSEDSMEPWIITLDRFESKFRASDSAAEDFTAHMSVETADGESFQETIKVNYPLDLGGAKVYLMGNGHAPTVTVRDAAGEIAFSGSVPFLSEDAQYTSKGVIKVPDVSTGEQLGFVGYLLPTADLTDGGMRSIYPEALNPVLVLDLYRGDLGLDDGIPQNVYRLATENLTKVTATEDNPDPILLALGQTVELPDGLGTIEFSDIPRFAAFDLRYDPTLIWLLISSVAALVGISMSLFTPRRRVWVRAVEETDGTVHVALAGLARGDDSGLQGEVDGVAQALEPAKPLSEAEREALRLARREL